MGAGSDHAVRAHSRRAAVAAVTVGAVVIAGGLTGVAGAHGGDTGAESRRPSAQPAHPSERDDVVGRVTAVGGTTFTVAGPDGRATTVVTSGTTSFARRAAASLEDAVAGTWISARGDDSELGFVADQVALRPAPGGGSIGLDEGRSEEHFVAGMIERIDVAARTATVKTGDGVAVVVLTPGTRIVESGPITMRDVVPGVLAQIEGVPDAAGRVDAALVQLGAPRTPPVTD